MSGTEAAPRSGTAAAAARAEDEQSTRSKVAVACTRSQRIRYGSIGRSAPTIDIASNSALCPTPHLFTATTKTTTTAIIDVNGVNVDNNNDIVNVNTSTPTISSSRQRPPLPPPQGAGFIDDSHVVTTVNTHTQQLTLSSTNI